MPLPSITCPQCGKTSYHRKDIEDRYCGWCHQFHEDMMFVIHEAREPMGPNVRSIDAKLMLELPAPAWAEEHMREQQKEIRRLSDENRTLRETVADNGALVDKLRARLDSLADQQYLFHLEGTLERITKENDELRSGSALIVHGIDIAMQLVSALIAWMPEGQVLPPEVSGLKLQLDEAWNRIRRLK